MNLNRSRSLGLSLMGQGQGRESLLADSSGGMGNEFPAFDLPLVDLEGGLPRLLHLPVLDRKSVV